MNNNYLFFFQSKTEEIKLPQRLFFCLGDFVLILKTIQSVLVFV